MDGGEQSGVTLSGSMLTEILGDGIGSSTTTLGLMPGMVRFLDIQKGMKTLSWVGGGEISPPYSSCQQQLRRFPSWQIYQ